MTRRQTESADDTGQHPFPVPHASQGRLAVAGFRDVPADTAGALYWGSKAVLALVLVALGAIIFVA